MSRSKLKSTPSALQLEARAWSLAGGEEHRKTRAGCSNSGVKDFATMPDAPKTFGTKRIPSASEWINVYLFDNLVVIKHVFPHAPPQRVVGLLSWRSLHCPALSVLMIPAHWVIPLDVLRVRIGSHWAYNCTRKNIPSEMSFDHYNSAAVFFISRYPPPIAPQGVSSVAEIALSHLFLRWHPWVAVHKRPPPPSQVTSDKRSATSRRRCCLMHWKLRKTFVLAVGHYWGTYWVGFLAGGAFSCQMCEPSQTYEL